MYKFSLILPCYNESKSLASLLNQTANIASNRGFSPEMFRLVLVNNGSTDDTENALKHLRTTANGKYLDIVNIKKNEGYGNGIWQGLISTKSEYIGWSHADEQTNPEDAFKAYELISKNKNENLLVKGFRSGRNIKSQIITFGYQIFTLIFLFKNISEINAQPKVFHHSLLKKLTNPPKDFAFDLYVLLKAKENRFKIVTIPVSFPDRKHGQSSWASTFRSKFRTISKMILFIIKYRWNKA